MREIVFDTETTGLDPSPRIVCGLTAVELARPSPRYPMMPGTFDQLSSAKI